MMADAVFDDGAIRNQIIALQDNTYTTSIAASDVSPRQSSFYLLTIHQLDTLKTKNVFNFNDLEKLQIRVNKRLAECEDHYLQIKQYRINYGASNSRIYTCPDGSINNFNAAKLSLATKVIEFDIKRAKSLRAFYSAQNEYFGLIFKIKEVEKEIQKVLRDLIEHGITCEDFHAEMLGSKGRIAEVEELRVTRREFWLEWLDELL